MRKLRLLFALAAPTVGLLGLGCAPPGDSETQDEDERLGKTASALAQALAPEVEPNNTAAAATPIGNDTVVGSYVFNIGPVITGDTDFYSFTGNAGDRVFVATGTSFSPSSTDSILDLIAPDGTTVIENDNDNGSLSGSSSSIAGAALTQAGTHYLRVVQNGNTSTIRPLQLHVKTQSGTPTAEMEPNDMTPQALPAGGWVAGTISPATDVDVFTLNLNAGDTVFASLDLDPERDGTDTVGSLLFGPFANTFLQVNDAGGAGPDSEAIFVTVKNTGTYGVAVNSPAGAGTGTYQLSVSVHPAASQANCTTYTSSTAVAIPTGPGLVTSTITVPGNPRVADLDISFNINHANPPDLDLSLVSPKGTTIGLITDVGASTFPNLDLSLDDEAAYPAGVFTLMTGLTIQPESPYRLDWFDGQDAGGNWTLRVTDDAANNAGTLNSWSITICEPPPLAACPGGNMPVTPLNTDFEASDAGFTHNGTADTWAYGTPAQAPNFTDCASGTKCFKTNLTGNYSISSNQNLVSPPIDLTLAQAPIQASWSMKYQIENAGFDPAWVEVREVGGANPRRIWQWLGPTMSTDIGGATLQEVSGWGTFTGDLSAYAGKTVELVFHLQTDSSVVYPGMTIDDVKVSACPTQVCGNNVMEGTEQCDDGNTTSGDGCDSNCTPTGCGNSVVTMGEVCDDGNTTNGDGCDSNCTLTACGNGIATMGEACDDGNAVEGDGCDSNCTVSACGNNILAPNEGCDDGNLTDGDGCDSNCTMTACGNGIPTMGEACDDGNAVEGDGCDSNCTVSACGNNILAPNETCDDGNTADGDGCDSNCTPTGCGNGVVTLGEMCDDGNSMLGDGCDDGMMGNCTPSACGNGVLAGGEGCDDGNLTDGDGCDSNCVMTGCGNGIMTMGEDCDDGNATSGDGCDNNCTVTACGNGVQTDGEACDDGNLDEGDGCDTNCTVSACGNNIVAPDEGCDDGNATDGDGCDSNCTMTGCGNGIVTTGEDCDDGNSVLGDGCDDGMMGNCTATACGNGIVTDGEECDDGNTTDGDGCDSKCSNEGQGGAGGGGAGGGGAGGASGGSGGTGGGTGGATGGTGGSSGEGGGGGGISPEGGCGCRVAGEESPAAPWAPALALFGLGALRLRRRRARG